jgi:hypothetical protein
MGYHIGYMILKRAKGLYIGGSNHGFTTKEFAVSCLVEKLRL